MQSSTAARSADVDSIKCHTDDVPAHCLGQWPFESIPPPPCHQVSVHSAKISLLPVQAKPRASTATGRRCCKLEKRKQKRKMEIRRTMTGLCEAVSSFILSF